VLIHYVKHLLKLYRFRFPVMFAECIALVIALAGALVYWLVRH
jgi:hypothetical protein